MSPNEGETAVCGSSIACLSDDWGGDHLVSLWPWINCIDLVKLALYTQWLLPLITDAPNWLKCINPILPICNKLWWHSFNVAVSMPHPAPSMVPPCRPEPDTTPLISEIEFFHFALDIARALDFLASQQYVHRDIAARNCLGELHLYIFRAHCEQLISNGNGALYINCMLIAILWTGP